MERGLTLIYTGDGKGKTTASIGLAVRALGQGLRVAIFQFIKSPDFTYGEKRIMDQLGIRMERLGIGYTWTKTADEQRNAVVKAWQIVKSEVMSGSYDLVILDELNNLLANKNFPIDDILPTSEVLDLIKNRPAGMHLVITGRDAKPEIIAASDLVSNVEMVKHYYNEGITAVLGLEY